jgi:hypothetical protein
VREHQRIPDARHSLRVLPGLCLLGERGAHIPNSSVHVMHAQVPPPLACFADLFEQVLPDFLRKAYILNNYFIYIFKYKIENNISYKIIITNVFIWTTRSIRRI